MEIDERTSHLFSTKTQDSKSVRSSTIKRVGQTSLNAFFKRKASPEAAPLSYYDYQVLAYLRSFTFTTGAEITAKRLLGGLVPGDSRINGSLMRYLEACKRVTKAGVTTRDQEGRHYGLATKWVIA